MENARLYRNLQRAVRARDQVLAVVAHDLRNPLGTILLQLARVRCDDEDRGRRSPADAIKRAVTRMNRIIQDVLDVNRLEAGKLPLQSTRVSPRALALELLESQEPIASAASIALVLDFADELPEIWADRDRLLQVFENLVGNALKFVAAGGRITIGATRREADVLFTVRDTGAGIAAEHLPHVFERFWQAREGERRGAGLGLPIVKGIVEAHGGRVWVESQPGVGSTFSFTIRTAPPRAGHVFALLPRTNASAEHRLR
jgi:signal transduction histidine kinase